MRVRSIIRTIARRSRPVLIHAGTVILLVLVFRAVRIIVNFSMHDGHAKTIVLLTDDFITAVVCIMFALFFIKEIWEVLRQNGSSFLLAV